MIIGDGSTGDFIWGRRRIPSGTSLTIAHRMIENSFQTSPTDLLFRPSNVQEQLLDGRSLWSGRLANIGKVISNL